MWKITTRGFTLQEVLLMVVMNVTYATDEGEQRSGKDPRTETHQDPGDCHGKSN